MFVLLAMGVIGLTACSTVGKGRSTLALGKKPDGNIYQGDEFAALLTDEEAPQFRSMGAGRPLDDDKWRSLLAQRFGIQETNQGSAGRGDNPGPALPHIGSVTISVRDITRTPVFASFNLDAARQDKMVRLLYDDKIAAGAKEKLLRTASNSFATLPEIEERTVVDRYLPSDAEENPGAPLWRYFIELEIDLTGALESRRRGPAVQLSGGRVADSA